MRNSECVALLQWALPQLGLRWEGFRGLHGQVCKRIARRAKYLGLLSFAEYRSRLEQDQAEWAEVDQACRVTISRFCRDRATFERLGLEVLPALAERTEHEGRSVLSAWSAGCASGEEPWSLALLWRMQVSAAHPGLRFEVCASDSDEGLLARARAARYGSTSLRELPDAWREQAFVADAGGFSMRDEFRHGVTFRREDLRQSAPEGPFDLVLCRNSAFSYFAEPLQQFALEHIAGRLRPFGVLVIGRHERLPTPHALSALGPDQDFFYRPHVP